VNAAARLCRGDPGEDDRPQARTRRVLVADVGGMAGLRQVGAGHDQAFALRSGCSADLVWFPFPTPTQGIDLQF